jgi:phenylalanyl-tRNA synthetase alpha chain
MQVLLDNVVNSLTKAWGCVTEVHRQRPLVSVEDNYDRLGYGPADVTRDARYTRYVSPTVMLRSHTTAGIPPALRRLAERHRDRDLSSPLTRGQGDVLLVLPGLCYRRDVIDRLHVGAPHQMDLWRITRYRMTRQDLRAMVGMIVEAVLPAAVWRVTDATHPYTSEGWQVDVHTTDGWVELAECGLAAPHVLALAGLNPDQYSGLALGMGLDRSLMLRKGFDDIRLLRSTDLRIVAQMHDLAPWRPVSNLPPVRRDVSVVITGPLDEEVLGDTVRSALGVAAEDLESLTVLNAAGEDELPTHVRQRLGMRPGQINVLLRMVLRPLGATLTDQRANELRDLVYAAIHEGPHHDWVASVRASGPDARLPLTADLRR